MIKTAARPRRVLVVEDDPALSRAVSLNLRKHLGIEVEVADNGRRAIEIAESQWVDLVCLDLMLPEVSGFGVFEHLRSSPGLRDIPVVVISGRRLPEDRARALEMGAHGYIVKPFYLSALRAKVAAVFAAKDRGQASG